MDDKKGVQAIIELQAVVGITEPEDRARREWDKMSEYEKRVTMESHREVCGILDK